MLKVNAYVGEFYCIKAETKIKNWSDVTKIFENQNLNYVKTFHHYNVSSLIFLASYNWSYFTFKVLYFFYFFLCFTLIF